nr:hypothetical protein [Tanacetum cinerariifolium]
MVASIAIWSQCASQDDIDVYKAYVSRESLFSLKVNYVGCFTESPVHELNDMVKKIGFSGKTIMYYSFLKLDMNLDNGLYALGNDEDVRRMAEYIRLGYNMIEVFIEHEKTIVFTYIDDAYNTPKQKCVIMEIPDGVSPKNAPVSKMKPRRPVSGNGESSQPNTANPTTQTDFANEFYSASDPFMGVEDFDPFFGLDSKPVEARYATNECEGKGKEVALDDDQLDVETDNTMDNETGDGNSDNDSSDSSEHDELVDVDNELFEKELPWKAASALTVPYF